MQTQAQAQASDDEQSELMLMLIANREFMKDDLDSFIESIKKLGDATTVCIVVLECLQSEIVTSRKIEMLSLLDAQCPELICQELAHSACQYLTDNPGVFLRWKADYKCSGIEIDAQTAKVYTVIGKTTKAHALYDQICENPVLNENIEMQALIFYFVHGMVDRVSEILAMRKQEKKVVTFQDRFFAALVKLGQKVVADQELVKEVIGSESTRTDSILLDRLEEYQLNALFYETVSSAKLTWIEELLQFVRKVRESIMATLL